MEIDGELFVVVIFLCFFVASRGLNSGEDLYRKRVGP